MAEDHRKRRFALSDVDSWLAVFQWVWERAFAFIASAAGATAMGFLAKATGWITDYGPIAWGGIALGTFVVIYVLLIWGRGRLAVARQQRAAAMIAERTAEHASVNPSAPDFKHQRVRLTDLYTPFGAPIEDRAFRDCDLIGPAVLWLSPGTVFRDNFVAGVEYIRIDAATARQWPNKLAVVRGSIERCRLYNVIVLVHDEDATEFAKRFTFPVQWMNDPIPANEPPKLQLPQGTEAETPQ